MQVKQFIEAAAIAILGLSAAALAQPASAQNLQGGYTVFIPGNGTAEIQPQMSGQTGYRVFTQTQGSTTITNVQPTMSPR